MNGKDFKMVLTLTVEPAVERKARSFAEERGTTLDALVGDFLEGIARRKASRPAFFDVPRRLTEEGEWRAYKVYGTLAEVGTEVEPGVYMLNRPVPLVDWAD